MLTDEKPLIYKVTKMEPTRIKHEMMFTIEIIDEHTLQVLEKKYPGHLQFDGGRIFTLRVIAMVKGLAEREPSLWNAFLEERPELVQKFVLDRLRGDA